MRAKFLYNEAYGITIYYEYEASLIPDAASFERNFRAKLHWLSSDAFQHWVVLVHLLLTNLCI